MKKSLHDEVSDYYGKTLQTSSDLKTNACCTVEVYPNHIKSILSQIHDEVLAKYYGCGLVIPEVLEGLNVIDLGSGAGRDVYLLSKLVGEKGSVVGIDMTDEQLAVANKHLEYHREKFGFQESNTSFLKARLEEMDQLDLKRNFYDLIISNCVINLCQDKEKVLQTSYDLLNEGGEIYFSDVYCNRRIPQELVNDPVLYGECLSGALYWNDFENLAKKIGFTDPRVVDVTPITIDDPKIIKTLEGFEFYSITYRLFKLDSLEPHCEDFGQAVTYKGSIDHKPKSFKLDDHHIFPTGKIVPVCGNSFNMLKETRHADHFEFHGNFDTHYGIFEGCGTNAPYTNGTNNSSEGESCC